MSDAAPPAPRAGLEVVEGYRVIYGDTDAMKVVYNANYLRFFERGRGAFLRAIGGDYTDFEARGFQLPVSEATLKFHTPARYDDLIEIHTRLVSLRGASVIFDYRVTRDLRLLCSGSTRHACVEATSGAVVPLPDDMRALLGPTLSG